MCLRALEIHGLALALVLDPRVGAKAAALSFRRHGCGSNYGSHQGMCVQGRTGLSFYEIEPDRLLRRTSGTQCNRGTEDVHKTTNRYGLVVWKLKKRKAARRV